MNKLSYPKPTLQKSLIHPGIVNYYGSTLVNSDYDPPYSTKVPKMLNHSPKHPPSFDPNLPHTWEFTDYDDDHFELS